MTFVWTIQVMKVAKTIQNTSTKKEVEKQDMSCMIGGTENGEPKIRRTGNTGVKGVLADYAEAKEKFREKQAIEKQVLQKMFESQCITVNNQPEKNEEDELDEDDLFLKEYHERRLAELKNQNVSTTEHHSLTPTFGFLRQISRDEYLDVIDNERNDIFVVIHLYQTYIQSCNKINKHLSELAPKYNTVKFLKIIASEAQPDFDEIGLPAVLVYRGGQLFKMFVPITLELPSLFTCKDLEVLFAKNGIIKSKADHVKKAKFYQSVKDNYLSNPSNNTFLDGDQNGNNDDDDDDEYD